MKLLLVLGSDETYNNIFRCIKPLGFELIRYTHVNKAMDNIDEIDPNAIIISARDYPRTWKTMVRFVRTDRAKDACPIIILKGDMFDIEESAKASYLGVSGIVTEDLDNSTEISRLHGILGRYLPVDEKRKYRRFQAENWHRLNFVFTHPNDQTLITGSVNTISAGGLSFTPENLSMLKGIGPDLALPECSLRTGLSILSPSCRVARTGPIISLEFLSFPGEEQDVLNNYIESLPLKEHEKSEKSQDFFSLDPAGKTQF